MRAEPDTRMSADERRTSLALAAVYATRMLGLFLVLPVLAEHARGLPGGEDAALVGLALGVYGLTQALLQLPFGFASDRLGRKPVITAGLLVFAAGSFLAATVDSVAGLVVARALQGAGAVAAALTALLADTTRDAQRTKAMAMIGATIGLSFALSLVLGPWLYGRAGMGGIFVVTGGLALAAIALVWMAVPRPAPPARAAGARFARVIADPDLQRLNLGIFALHATQTATFVVLPGMLVAHLGMSLATHWKLYLPVLAGSFLLMVPPIAWAERRARLRRVFLSAIVLVTAAQLGLAAEPVGLGTMALLLLVFFSGFNILEASLPSLVSRLAPSSARGAALGLYNTAQSLGLFAGGAAGGLVARHLGTSMVFVTCAAVLFGWLVVAIGHRRWPDRKAAGAAA